MSQTLQSVLCITTNKYLVCVLVVLLHARFNVASPTCIPFLLAAIFFPGHPYIGILPDSCVCVHMCVYTCVYICVYMCMCMCMCMCTLHVKKSVRTTEYSRVQ